MVLRSLAVFLSRAALSLFFLHGIVLRLLSPNAGTARLSALAVPWPVSSFMILVLLQGAAALLLFLGARTRFAASALITFVALEAYVFGFSGAGPSGSGPWAASAVAGGLMLLAVHGGGAFSLDRG